MAETKGLWAPIVKNPRTEWIVWTSVCLTRREAKRSYLEGFDPRMHKKMLKHVRFAKVSIVEQTPELITPRGKQP